MDDLVIALRDAEAKHAALLRCGDARAIRLAYIAALEAERALLLDCGGEMDARSAKELGFVIDDERADLAMVGL